MGKLWHQALGHFVFRLQNEKLIEPSWYGQILTSATFLKDQLHEALCFVCVVFFFLSTIWAVKVLYLPVAFAESLLICQAQFEYEAGSLLNELNH